MTEPVLIVFITSIGGTFLTVLGAILQQALAGKTQLAEHKKTQTATKTIQHDTTEGFTDLKAIMLTQQAVIDLILRDRLRFLLKQYQGKEEVSYADKEIIVGMYDIYRSNGHNGTIRTLFETFDKIPVT